MFTGLFINKHKRNSGNRIVPEQTRTTGFHVFLFLFLFLLFYYSYIALIAFVSPGGRWYSSFLDRYANVPVWLTYFISSVTKGLLKTAGYNAYQKAPNNVSIQGSPGVNIIWACLGFGVMSFWAAFVIAHKAGIRYKLTWLTAGIGLIILLNIFRIASIALANHYQWKKYKMIEPHFLFNVVSYIGIIALAALFLYWYWYREPRKVMKNKEKRKTALSTST